MLIDTSTVDTKTLNRMSLEDAIIRARTSPGETGPEKEFSQEVTRQTGQHPTGFFFPLPTIWGAGRRDLTITNQGSAFNQTTVANRAVDVLRNAFCLERLGAQMMAIRGNMKLPRVTAANTAQTLTETALGTASDVGMDGISFEPKRIFSGAVYSRQLQFQASLDVGNFVRDQLLRTIYARLEAQVLEGTAEDSGILGIKHTPGISTATFGGAPTWDAVTEFENQLAGANALRGRPGWIVSPSVMVKWKRTPRAGTYPKYLWESRDWNDGSTDGEVSGWRAAFTGNISENKVVFGNWDDCLVGVVGGAADVCVNPYEKAAEGKIAVIINIWVDAALAHVKSYCWSTDAGNQ